MYDAQKACALNDAFRTTFVGGQVLVTQGIRALRDIATVLKQVREFDKFDESNDPLGEHDFGTISHETTQIFWKIDYYDLDMIEGSPDPADITVTRRVLTIMLAEEY